MNQKGEPGEVYQKRYKFPNRVMTMWDNLNYDVGIRAIAAWQYAVSGCATIRRRKNVHIVIYEICRSIFMTFDRENVQK